MTSDPVPLDAPGSDPIELDVRSRDPVSLDVPGSAPVEWGASEYMPVVASGVPRYDGPYDVTPLAFEQVTLPTDGKLMEDDVTVREVPVYEVSNESGTTVYIATLEG